MQALNSTVRSAVFNHQYLEVWKVRHKVGDMMFSVQTCVVNYGPDLYQKSYRRFLLQIEIQMKEEQNYKTASRTVI